MAKGSGSFETKCKLPDCWLIHEESWQWKVLLGTTTSDSASIPIVIKSPYINKETTESVEICPIGNDESAEEVPKLRF